MQAALDAALGPELTRADALVMAAAVADYRPGEVHAAKMKRTGATTLELVPNPDILAGLGGRREGGKPLLVGFALETVSGDALICAARDKLNKKRVDLIVANSASDAFDGDDNRIVLVSRDDSEELPRASKRVLADQLLDRLLPLLP